MCRQAQIHMIFNKNMNGSACMETEGFDETVCLMWPPSHSVGHNEIIGVCRVGNEAESLGRGHWNEMLSYPRKPIAHWHPLVEVQFVCVCVCVNPLILYVRPSVFLWESMCILMEERLFYPWHYDHTSQREVDNKP